MAYHLKNRSKEESEFYELLGDRIKMFRIAKGMSRMDLAIDLNMTNTSIIVQYEEGKRVPCLYRLHEIAKALEIDLKELIPDI